jgi:FkbM family methyltransferase
MRIAKAFRHLVEHVAWLGPVTGLRVLYLKKVRPGREAVVRVPGLAGPLTVRTGTSDLAIFDEVVIQNGYHFPLARDPQVIVDVGANIGMATLWFKARWPQAQVIAVEPDPNNFALLQRNLKDIPGVRTVQAALAPADGAIGFETEGLNPSAYHIRALRPGEEGVPAITMATLMRQCGIDHIDLLKLDIEGAEKEVFEAPDLAWMDRVDTLAVELHDRMRPGCGHAFFKATSQSPRNYDVHEYLVIATKA